MRQETEKNIFRYIDFLRETGYVVTLSCINPAFLAKSSPVLFNYEHHLCAICFFLKAHPATRNKCIKFKDLLIHSETREALYDCCWAGVEEHVFPIICSGQLLCRVHLSGYRGTLKKSRRRAKVVAEKTTPLFTKLYEQLSDQVPTQDSLERLVRPLAYMFDVLYRENLTERSEADCEDLYHQTLRYIYDHYMENIQVETIAQAVNYSPSYLRATFLKMNGKSLMEYVNIVRLTHAADLLRFTNLSITEIAYECGFRDGNYFSTAFKKFYGVSPRAFRNNLAKP